MRLSMVFVLRSICGETRSSSLMTKFVFSFLVIEVSCFSLQTRITAKNNRITSETNRAESF